MIIAWAKQAKKCSMVLKTLCFHKWLQNRMFKPNQQVAETVIKAGREKLLQELNETSPFPL